MHKNIFNFESITYSVKQRENAFAAPLIILRSIYIYIYIYSYIHTIKLSPKMTLIACKQRITI